MIQVTKRVGIKCCLVHGLLRIYFSNGFVLESWSILFLHQLFDSQTIRVPEENRFVLQTRTFFFFFCIVLSSLFFFFLRTVNMSFKDNPCRKFQANIFNKSKCQNCFKPRELHLLNDEDLNQVNKCTLHWLNVAWIMDYEVDHGVQKTCLIEYNCFLAPGLILTLIQADGSNCSTVCCLLPQNDYHLGHQQTWRCRCWQNSVWVLQ